MTESLSVPVYVTREGIQEISSQLARDAAQAAFGRAESEEVAVRAAQDDQEQVVAGTGHVLQSSEREYIERRTRHYFHTL